MEWPGNKATFIVAPRPLYFAAMERSQEMPVITSSCAPNKCVSDEIVVGV